MKNKKIIIGIVVALLVIASVVLVVLKLGKNEKFYTVKFDTDGGSQIADIKIKENTKLVLPSNPTKDGYTFVEWLLENTKFDTEMLINKDITLKASWLSNEVPKVTIKFDTVGGSSVEDMIIEKSTSITLPNTSKNGYTFVKWQDETGNKVTNETVYENDVTLKAVWKENAKTYTCPDGYRLDGTKCYKVVDAIPACTNGSYSVNGKCAKISSATSIDVESNCPRLSNPSDEMPLKIINAGPLNGCYYSKDVNITNMDNCKTQGYYWSGSFCYKEKRAVEESCPSGYVIVKNPKSYNSNFNKESTVCSQEVSPSYHCSDTSYTLNGNKCTKVVDATLK